MKTAFFEIDEEEKKFLSENNKLEKEGIDSVFFEDPLNEENLPEEKDFEAISIFIGSKLTPEVLQNFKNLKLVVTSSTGFDHIDLGYCREHDIKVSNVPSYGEHTVAEYAFALILALSRRIYEAYENVRDEGDWSVKGIRGFDLKEKTIGIVGTGSIGRNSVKIARGFGMNVLAFDVNPDENFAKEQEIEYVEFEELLEKSDIVTLHVPYLESTHHLINENNIRKMKKGAYLINTSRGAVIETEALVHALQEKHLGGAGLDVLEEEGITKDEFGYLLAKKEGEENLKTVIANHVLIDMPNVIITPHNAFNTEGAWKRIFSTTVNNLISFNKGEPINLVS
jgi:D-lactate dehydrogenase